jgi:hypothetical protein
MKNQTNPFIRTILIFLLFALLLTSCKPVKNPDYQTVRSQAATLAADQQAAMDLVGDKTLQEAAPALWAIEQASMLAPGAFMVVNRVKDVAIFVAQGGLAPNGSPYTFIGFIDTAHNCIVDATRQSALLKIDFTQIKTLTELKDLLRSKGFVELTEETAPSLLMVIRLALGYLKSVGAGISQGVGATISDVLVVPAIMLTPEYYFPWCDRGKGCQTIEQ